MQNTKRVIALGFFDGTSPVMSHPGGTPLF